MCRRPRLVGHLERLARWWVIPRWKAENAHLEYLALPLLFVGSKGGQGGTRSSLARHRSIHPAMPPCPYAPVRVEPRPGATSSNAVLSSLKLAAARGAMLADLASGGVELSGVSGGRYGKVGHWHPAVGRMCCRW